MNGQGWKDHEPPWPHNVWGILSWEKDAGVEDGHLHVCNLCHPWEGLCCRRWDVLIVLCPVPCWGCVDTAVAPERWFRNAAGTAVLSVFGATFVGPHAFSPGRA